MDGDGAYFGSPHSYATLGRISGALPNHHIKLIAQFRELRIRDDHTPEELRQYICCPLAADTWLHVCL